MRTHPYLRAYMAGVLVPTWVLLIVLAGYVAGSAGGWLPEGLDRALIFPMAVVPNLWGVWNLLYVALGLRERIPLGAFGAALPLLLVPAGLGLAGLLGLGYYKAVHAAMVLPLGMAIYYLAWKYVVAFFNRVVGV